MIRPHAGGGEPVRAVVVASAFGLQPLLEALIGLPFAVRVAVTAAVLAPVGMAMGMAMPIGLRRLAIRHPAGVAFAWGVNGVASVLGSVLAVALSIGAGFRVATLVAAFCYGLALVHSVRGAWSAEPEPAAAEPALAPVG